MHGVKPNLATQACTACAAVALSTLCGYPSLPRATAPSPRQRQWDNHQHLSRCKMLGHRQTATVGAQHVGVSNGQRRWIPLLCPLEPPSSLGLGSKPCLVCGLTGKGAHAALAQTRAASPSLRQAWCVLQALSFLRCLLRTPYLVLAGSSAGSGVMCAGSKLRRAAGAGCACNVWERYGLQ